MKAISDGLDKELDIICDAMTQLHPMGEVKHVGRRELVRALKDVLQTIERIIPPGGHDIRPRAVSAIKVIEKALEAKASQ